MFVGRLVVGTAHSSTYVLSFRIRTDAVSRETSEPYRLPDPLSCGIQSVCGVSAWGRPVSNPGTAPGVATSMWDSFRGSSAGMHVSREALRVQRCSGNSDAERPSRTGPGLDANPPYLSGGKLLWLISKRWRSLVRPDVSRW